MVWVEAPVSADVVERLLKEGGVRVFGGEATEMRFVVHREIGTEGVERVLTVLERGFKV